jgi:hypothetical protein
MTRARLQHRGPYSKANFSGKIIIRYPAHNETHILVPSNMFDAFERVHRRSGMASAFRKRNIAVTNP